MERDSQVSTNIDVSQGVLLLDHYDEQSEMLKKSFRLSGFQGPVIVIDGDGFISDDVISVYEYFINEEIHEKDVVRKPRFFNQIERPDYWEISANGTYGEIYDKQYLRGKIFYARHKNRRIVRDVDWYGENKEVRFSDHYDQYGNIYARTTFNKKGQRFCRSLFDENGKEKIVENYVTNTIIVNRHNQVHIFENLTALCVQMLKEIGADGSRIFYNSLSTPLFVVDQMANHPRGHVLFWQENPRDDIPGNMLTLFNENSSTKQIFVQNRQSYEKLIQLGAPNEVLQPFGFVYDFDRQNEHRKDILICTNSDQLEGLDLIVQTLKDCTIHIVAITEMSSKLLQYGTYENVRLYPTVKDDKVQELFMNCDYYFDINYGIEIMPQLNKHS